MDLLVFFVGGWVVISLLSLLLDGGSISEDGGGKVDYDFGGGEVEYCEGANCGDGLDYDSAP